MIIKSLRHTQFLSNYSVNYVFDGMSNEPEHRWVIFQNVSSGYDRKSIIKEFNSNAEYLTKTQKRKRCYRYHEVLAFAHENSQDLSREKLQRICNEYLKLRDPQGLSKAVCVPHLDKGHYHIHILLTSNFLESSRSGDMRMSNKRYYEIRRSMERWVLREMGELHRSTVYLDEKEIEQILPERYSSERRLLQLGKKPAKNRNHTKDKVAQRIKELLAQSNTLEQFETLINAESDLKTYQRSGRLTGVIYNNRKYRLKNLIPLYQENFQVLKRMQELERINNHQRSIERER